MLLKAAKFLPSSGRGPLAVFSVAPTEELCRLRACCGESVTFMGLSYLIRLSDCFCAAPLGADAALLLLGDAAFPCGDTLAAGATADADGMLL